MVRMRPGNSPKRLMISNTSSARASSAAEGVGNCSKKLEMHSCFNATLATRDMSAHAMSNIHASCA